MANLGPTVESPGRLGRCNQAAIFLNAEPAPTGIRQMPPEDCNWHKCVTPSATPRRATLNGEFNEVRHGHGLIIAGCGEIDLATGEHRWVRISSDDRPRLMIRRRR
jgi:hypothetical protein